MVIYKLRADVDNYDNLYPSKSSPLEVMRMFDGRPLKKKWKPLKVERMEPEKGLPLGDFPGFTIPVFSDKALKVLYPLIKEDVELLDLKFEKGGFQAVNVTTVLDCLDYENSDYLLYKSSGRIMVIEKYVFHANKIGNRNIFKLIDEPIRWCFCNERFKNAVESNRLQGFLFEEVWRDE